MYKHVHTYIHISGHTSRVHIPFIVSFVESVHGLYMVSTGVNSVNKMTQTFVFSGTKGDKK